MNFKEPAPPTQAAFFFFATEMMNPCMWSTDFDFKQAPYVPGNGLRSATCEGCAVRGALRTYILGPHIPIWCRRPMYVWASADPRVTASFAEVLYGLPVSRHTRASCVRSVRLPTQATPHTTLLAHGRR